jgi:uncharacterized protein
MSTTGLLVAAALAGLAGSPHCVAMCGAGCAALTREGRWRSLAFQAGRLTGYATLGAIVAASAGALQWSASHAAVLKPFWAMLHVAVIMLGLSLVWLGAQPAWVERASQRVWQGLRMRTLPVDRAHWPFAAGVLWAALPCGLLYAALMLAALADTPLHGAAVMGAFALASGAGLQLGVSQWQRLRRGSRRFGVRVAGVALAAASAWALVHGVWDSVVQWCA